MSTYPSITAGQEITSTLLTSMLPDIVYKTANEDRTATTTLADDTELTTTLAASAVYHVRIYLHYAALDAAKIKTAWTVPSGASGLRSAIGAGSAATDATAATTSRFGVHAFTTTVTYGTRSHATNQCVAIEEGIVTTTSAGTLAIQWAQDTSNATATRVGSGSSLHVTRIA